MDHTLDSCINVNTLNYSCHQNNFNINIINSNSLHDNIIVLWFGLSCKQQTLILRSIQYILKHNTIIIGFHIQ
jgi:hypothetical protein